MRYVLFPFLVFIISLPATAQITGTDATERLELSRELHKVKPIKPQIDRAIERVAGQLPEAGRDRFAASVRRSLSYAAIEKFSIDAMAELFTKAELDAMVEYYSKPEAKSASEKLPDYQDRLRPEIIKMLDKALMEMKTGGAG